MQNKKTRYTANGGGERGFHRIEALPLSRYHGRHSTVLASQLPVKLWHDNVGDPTIADALLDRLVHNAHKLELDGESIRKARGTRRKSDD